MDYNQAFAVVFRRLRRHRGLTQEDFHDAVSVRYVRNLEKGEYSPSLSTVRDICDVLRISPMTLTSLVEAEYKGISPLSLLKTSETELTELGAA